MKFFLPDGTHWMVVVIFWCLLILIGVLFAALVFWVKKYIKDNDTHHASVEKRLSSQSEQFGGLADKLDDGVKKIDKATVDMAKTQANFQTSVSKELVDIHKVTGAIKNDLTEGRSQVKSMVKDMDKITETVTAHHKSLGEGALAMVSQRKKLLDMKSEIVRINEDLMIIKGKPTKETK